MHKKDFSLEQLREMTPAEQKQLWLNKGHLMEEEKDGICHYELLGGDLCTFHFYFDYECVNNTELEVVAVIRGDIYGLPSDSYISKHNLIHKSGAVHYLSNPPVGKEGFEVAFSDFPQNSEIFFAVNIVNTDGGEHSLRDVSEICFYCYDYDDGYTENIRSVNTLPRLREDGIKAFYFIRAGYSVYGRVDVNTLFLYSKKQIIANDTGITPTQKPQKPQRIFGKVYREERNIHQNTILSYSIPLGRDGLVPVEYYDSSTIYKEHAWRLSLKGYNYRINTIDFEKLSPNIETVILTATTLTGELSNVKYSLIDEFDYSEIYSFDVGENFPEAKTVIIGKLIREPEGFRFEAYTEAFDEEFLDVFKRFAPDRRIMKKQD